jgi:hypothetical protein
VGYDVQVRVVSFAGRRDATDLGEIIDTSLWQWTGLAQVVGRTVVERFQSETSGGALIMTPGTSPQRDQSSRHLRIVEVLSETEQYYKLGFLLQE